VQPGDVSCGESDKGNTLPDGWSCKITQLGENGTEVILRLTSPGDVIGDLGLVPG